MTAVQIRNDDGTTTAADATVRPAVSPMEVLTTELAVTPVSGGKPRIVLLLTTGHAANLGNALNGGREPVENRRGLTNAQVLREAAASLRGGQYVDEETRQVLAVELLAIAHELDA
jgi:hypothetical protein